MKNEHTEFWWEKPKFKDKIVKIFFNESYSKEIKGHNHMPMAIGIKIGYVKK